MAPACSGPQKRVPDVPDDIPHTSSAIPLTVEQFRLLTESGVIVVDIGTPFAKFITSALPQYAIGLINGSAILVISKTGLNS